MIRSMLLVLLGLLVVGVVVAEYRTGGAFSRSAGREGSVLRPLPAPFANRELVRLVLIGADDRKDRGRSDTLMVLYVAPRTGRAALVSLPRDLYVDIPGHQAGKINHAYRFGGGPLAQRTVESVLGIETDGYITVNLQGFVKAVDALGGVDIDVEDAEGEGRGMNYDCPQDGLVIHLRPGRQHLTGYKAMGYVRYRKSNIKGRSSSDFQRADRQQKFMRAIIDQKLRPTELRALVRAGMQVLRHINSTLTWRETFDLVRCLRALGPGDLVTMTLPVTDGHVGLEYVCRLDATRLRELEATVSRRLQSEPKPPGMGMAIGARETPRVEVLNGSGKAGAAAKVAEALKAAGFEVVRVANAPAYDQQHTTIMYREDSRAIAERAMTVVGEAVLEYDDGGPTPAGQPHIQVVIGRDHP